MEKDSSCFLKMNEICCNALRYLVPVLQENEQLQLQVPGTIRTLVRVVYLVLIWIFTTEKLLGSNWLLVITEMEIKTLKQETEV